MRKSSNINPENQSNNSSKFNGNLNLLTKGLIWFRNTLNRKKTSNTRSVIFKTSVQRFKYPLQFFATFFNKKGKFDYENSNFSDTPIESESEDFFGFQNLAERIAWTIENETQLEGTVIAIHGPWGSGKSSLINLIQEELDPQKKHDKFFAREVEEETEFEESTITQIENNSINTENHDNFQDSVYKSNTKLSTDNITYFSCFWFKNEKALISEFFNHLSNIVAKNDCKAKSAIRQLKNVAIAVAKPGFDYILDKHIPGLSMITSPIFSFFEVSSQKDTLNQKIDKLNHLLKEKRLNYLIIIDDLDRLPPDELLLMFKLIKTVGKLTNVSYLVAYDPQIAQDLLEAKYPIDKPNFLEKIVQTGFCVPKVSQNTFRIELLKFISKLTGNYYYEMIDENHFKCLFENIVLPCIKTPRDFVRFCNTIKVTLPTVSGEVCIIDFISIEALRIKFPNLYYNISGRKSRLVIDKFLKGGEGRLISEIDEILKSMDIKYVAKDSKESETTNDLLKNESYNVLKKKFKIGLMEMFPAYEVSLEEEIRQNFIKLLNNKLSREKQICVERFFDSYFQFSTNNEILEQRAISTIATYSNEEKFNSKFFEEFINHAIKYRDSTKMRYFLQDLYGIVSKIFQLQKKPFLKQLLGNYKAISELLILDDKPEIQNSIVSYLEEFFSLYLDYPFGIKQRTQTFSEIIGKNSERNFDLIFDLACLYICRREQGVYDSLLNDDTTTLLLFSKEYGDSLVQSILNQMESFKPRQLMLQQNLLNLLYWWDKLGGDNNFTKATAWFTENIENENSVKDFVSKFNENIIYDKTGKNGPNRKLENFCALSKITDLDAFKLKVEKLICSRIILNLDIEKMYEFLENLERYQAKNSDSPNSRVDSNNSM